MIIYLKNLVLIYNLKKVLNPKLFTPLEDENILAKQALIRRFSGGKHIIDESKLTWHEWIILERQAIYMIGVEKKLLGVQTEQRALNSIS